MNIRHVEYFMHFLVYMLVCERVKFHTKVFGENLKFVLMFLVTYRPKKLNRKILNCNQ